MFTKYDKFNEALKLSVAKKYTKIWLQSNMENYLNDWFKDNDRIYIPMDTNININQLRHDSELKANIENVLKSLGYEIESYLGNLCKKIGTNKNFTKITKALQKTNSDLVETYNNELNYIGVSNDYMVVISRHPVDIAGMSTDRGWSSCMDLNNPTDQTNAVEADLKHGSIISYLIKNDDKNIQNPISRLLLKPFVDKNGKSWLFPEKVYGTPNQFFQKTVELWLESLQGKSPEGVYNIKYGLYADISKTVNIFSDKLSEINDFIKKNKIEKYTINADNTIDIHDDFYIFEIVENIKINVVDGDFTWVNCYNFDACPNYVKGNMMIENYYGSNMYGCTKRIDKNFEIRFFSKHSITLVGFPNYIGGECIMNGSSSKTQLFSNMKYMQNSTINGYIKLAYMKGLKDLAFLPKIVDELNIRYCDLQSTKGLNKSIINNDITLYKCTSLTKLEDFPKVVNGSLNLNETKLKTTDGFPEKVIGTLYIENTGLRITNVKTIYGHIIS